MEASLSTPPDALRIEPAPGATTIPDARDLPADFTSLARRSGGSAPGTTTLPAGSTIASGRFEIIRRIGAGGMGTVYEALDRRMGRRVALKIVRETLSQDPTSTLRFEREARAASRIVSPSIVTLHDFGRDESGALYIVMELLVGESLLTRMCRAPLSTQEASALAADIAGALIAAHDAGVVHRDLKPDNVFLPATGGIKVLDFGIASILDDASAAAGTGITQQGTIVGTPLYMSPEAIGKRPVGPAADLYALGIMLFEMIAGRPPFDDPEPVVVLGKHLLEKAPSLGEAAPDVGVPAALDRLVASLLDKSTEGRPSSARAVETALRAITFDDPAATAHVHRASPRTAATFVVARPRRTWTVPAIAAASTAVLLATAVTAMWAGTRPSEIAARPLPLRESPSPTSPAPSVPLPSPTPTGLPGAAASSGEITITVRPTPTDATLTWDGVPITSPFRVLRDHATHVLGVEAERHGTLTLEVTADVDHDVAPVLAPLTPAPHRRGGSGEAVPPTPRLRGW